MNPTWTFYFFAIVSSFLVISAEQQQQEIMKKFVDYLNNMRRQMGFEGTRKMHWDDELMDMASSKAKQCDESKVQTGNDGAFSFKLGSSEPLQDARSITSTKEYMRLTRSTFDRRSGKCRPRTESTCSTILEMLNPQAFLIGCDVNYECEEGLLVCYTNRRVITDGFVMRADRNACPECTESFHCGDEAMCDLKDPSMPKNLPEDSTELVEPKSRGNSQPTPSQSRGRESSAALGSDGEDNSSQGLGASAGLVLAPLLMRVLLEAL